MSVIITDRMVKQLRTAVVIGASVILAVQVVILALVVYVALYGGLR